MAKNSDNLFTDGFRGTVGGNMTFTRRKSGKVIVKKKRGANKTEPQEEHLERRSKFKRAIIYATNIIKNLATKALYQSKVVGDQTAFNVATRDAYKAPEVVKIIKDNYNGQIGDQIMVEATDDFKVGSVKVAIYTMDNELVEQGAAVLDDSGLTWIYTATEDHVALDGSTIKATAKDLPGNEGTLTVTL